jgi:hypothetical protein
VGTYFRTRENDRLVIAWTLCFDSINFL